GGLRVADEPLAGHDLVAVAHGEQDPAGDRRIGVLRAVVADDGDRPLTSVALPHPDDAGGAGQRGLALGAAGLEQLDDPGEAVGDVLPGHTTGVERPHGQRRAGLADGLGGDDPDRLAAVDHGAGGHHPAVALGADPDRGVAGARRPDADAGHRVVAGDLLHLQLADLPVVAG